MPSSDRAAESAACLADVFLRDEPLEQGEDSRGIGLHELKANSRGGCFAPGHPGHRSTELHGWSFAYQQAHVLAEAKRFLESAGTPAQSQIHHGPDHGRLAPEHDRPHGESRREALVGAEVPDAH